MKPTSAPTGQTQAQTSSSGMKPAGGPNRQYGPEGKAIQAAMQQWQNARAAAQANGQTSGNKPARAPVGAYQQNVSPTVGKVFTTARAIGTNRLR